MTLPTACYRLQFRQGMDFDRAAQIVPYLARLGVSHLYASPLFAAQPGSTHGYDVTDPTQIDPALGGRAGLERLSAALKAEGMGLVLDIVPNHMAFSVATPWLRDVLRKGRNSPYAGHFDFYPSEDRIRLPWLPAPFATVLSEGGIHISDDPDGPVLASGDLRVPLAQTRSLDAARSGDPNAMRALHAEQPWQLVHWRTESDVLSHRRFFNIAGLIGMRMDREQVFEDVHQLLFELVAEGTVNGIRIDHIDGLADPESYLRNLRARVGDTPVWVEKILSGSEKLPARWLTEGTTGYVAARAFTRLLTNRKGVEQIDEAYRAATLRTDPVEDVIWQARMQVMTQDLAAELWTLQSLLAEIAAQDPVAQEFGPESLRMALLAFIAGFPRYRTYTTQDHISRKDAALIADTATRAAKRLSYDGPLRFLAQTLSHTVTQADQSTALLRERMQQVTAAAVAKSQEDTAFYREVRLLSENEVGSEPGDGAIDVAAFHRLMEQRSQDMPAGLTLTSSHDTKRSEDARMRIAAITTAPEAFNAWFEKCRALAPDGFDPNILWYIAQSFLALDPSDIDFADRLSQHAIKAMREAKTDTFWTNPNAPLEDRVTRFVRTLAAAFPRHDPVVQPILIASDRMSLIQTALKLTVPGIPDIYQGCEITNHALTDPDNRRAVDFSRLAQGLADPDTLPNTLDRKKLGLTQTLLKLRKAYPDVFLKGHYLPIDAEADLCIFERHHGGQHVKVTLALTENAEIPPLGRAEHLVWPAAGDLANSPVHITRYHDV